MYAPGIICRKIVFLLKLFVLVKQSWLTVLELEQIEGFLIAVRKESVKLKMKVREVKSVKNR